MGGKTTTYFHKDANRDRWKLTVRKIGEHPNADNDGPDFRWEYVLYREDVKGYRRAFRESYFGQGDHRPSAAEIMADFARRMVALAIGLSGEKGR